MATCDPIASPSGRECEVTTKRCRWRMASRIAAIDSALIRIVGCERCVRCRGCNRCVGDFAQQLLDAILVADALVELEGDFRGAAQAKALADLPPHEAGRALEGAGSGLARRGVAEARVEHARVLQIWTYLHAGDG